MFLSDQLAVLNYHLRHQLAPHFHKVLEIKRQSLIGALKIVAKFRILYYADLRESKGIN